MVNDSSNCYEVSGHNGSDSRDVGMRNLDEESNDLIGAGGVDGVEMVNDTLGPLERALRERLSTVLGHYRGEVVQLGRLISRRFTHLSDTRTHTVTDLLLLLDSRTNNSLTLKQT